MILIVDDRQENILPLKKILELHGLVSDEALSGEEALVKILKNEYSLVIMDVQMPGMDGFEVVETMASFNRTREIPVIFLSAISKEKKYFFKGFEVGAVDYITKPVDPELFILRVKSFLKIYDQTREIKRTRDMLFREIEIRKKAQSDLEKSNDNLEQKIQERTKEILSKNEELEIRNHELQQFSWVVSHDLKEPLRKIETFIKIIRDRYVIEDDKGKDYIERTVKSANRMTRQIDDLLEYSRLSANNSPSLISMDVLIDEVIQDFDNLIELKNAQILKDKLPEVNGVYSQLRQLFQNLISNALKFSRQGIPPIITIKSISISERDFNAKPDNSGTFCRIEISDNGIGFDETYLEKIFVIFQSVHDRKFYDGTGIGLAIAKKIIEKHHGLITAKSEPGVGSTFMVILPKN